MSVDIMSMFTGSESETLESVKAVLLRGEEISNMQREINNFLGSQSQVARVLEPLKTLFNDIDHQKQFLLSAERIFDACRNQDEQSNIRFLINEQLEETQKSKDTAIGVQRLTRLGFVFIPLNFVCAMLGMNMAAFGQGTLSMWWFFFLGFLFLGLTTIPVNFATELDRLDRHFISLALQIAWRSPVAAFWYICYGLTHNSANLADLNDAGLIQALQGSAIEMSDRIRDGKRGGALYWYCGWSAEGKGDSSGYFWLSKLQHIFRLLDTPDWEKHSFIYHAFSSKRVRKGRTQASVA